MFSSITKKAVLLSKLTFSGYGAGTCSKAVPHTTAPKISQYYTTFMMEMGLDAHLKCLTVGKHSTEWLGPDDESLPVNSDKYQILPDGSLIIKTLTFDVDTCLQVVLIGFNIFYAR